MENKNKKDNGSFVSAELFISALVIIGILMVLSYVLTLIVPCEGISFGRFILSPFLVLGSEGNITLIGVILFLLIIGGVFNSLERAGIMRYMLDKIADKYGNSRYKLMSVLMLFFMALGSLIGSFEEVVPMVPVVVALAVRLGWDPITGLAMSLLSVGCGFAAGVFNPFTVGIAQGLAGLPLFSGWWFRAVNFVFIYSLLWIFTRTHAKRVDKGVSQENKEEFIKDTKKDLGVKLFAIILGLGIVIVMSSAVVEAIRDYTFIIFGLMFMIAGICSCKASGVSSKELRQTFFKGLVSMLPAAFMLMMAASIRYILDYAGALEYIIGKAIALAQGLEKWQVVLFVYAFILVMNFFIPQGSAKAIMLIPLILPLTQSFGISSQLVIVAYAYGDGFSNVFYPTNPALLVSLGLADTKYKDWFKWSWKFQLANFVMTSLLLLLGMAIGV